MKKEEFIITRDMHCWTAQFIYRDQPPFTHEFSLLFNLKLGAQAAKKIAKDGEGASKFLEIRVEGARSVRDAQKMAMTVATSPLVKTALAGSDVATMAFDVASSCDDVT